jgi:uncharacterized membrane protein (UPF0127 family)
MFVIAILGACSSGARRDEGAAATTPPAKDATSGAATTMPRVYLSTPQGEIAVAVEVVATPAKIQRGLMFREHLPPDHGMLFLMSDERIWGFWMRNTLIPLDILFITKDMTVAGIVENAEPRTETLREVEKPSLYVLEVNGGYCAAHKVTAGARVRFEGVR